MPLLCIAHAQQVAGDQQPASGPCDPAERWMGGDGRERLCAVVEDPEAIDRYLSDVAERTSRASRAADETGPPVDA